MTDNYRLEKEWITKVGYPAIVTVVKWPTGEDSHRCGYVRIPEGHPFYGEDYETLESRIEVHGGLTFSGSGYFKDDKGWWFGFDCLHCTDAAIQMPFSLKGKLDILQEGIVRTLDYVIDQCEDLARQLKQLEGLEN